MISHLRGKIIEKGPMFLVIECAGVGYQVYAPLPTIEKSGEINAEANLYIHFAMREDAIELYGFHSEEYRTLFRYLLSVTGIGPKIALNILSTVTPQELKAAVDTEDISLLTKLPGIGKKTAERIVVELRDKIKSLPITSEQPGTPMSHLRQEAVEALIALGYPRSIAEGAVKSAIAQIPESERNIESLIRLALKHAISR